MRLQPPPPLDIITELPKCLRVYVVIAHPDDAEGHAGGTIALLAAAGAKIYYRVLTRGGMGGGESGAKPTTIVETRTDEQCAAAQVLGVKPENVYFSDFTDGELADSPEVRGVIVRDIREIKPDMVIGWDPQLSFAPRYGFTNHRDHEVAGKVTRDAVYPDARNPDMFPEQLRQGLEIHTVRYLLLMTFSDLANCVIDVTDQLALKMKAMHAHTSQSGDADQDGDEEKVRAWTRKAGEAYGTKAAEAFHLIEYAI